MRCRIHHNFLLGECPLDTFRCGNKRCIQYSKVCDGKNDCNTTSLTKNDETDGCQGG